MREARGTTLPGLRASMSSMRRGMPEDGGLTPPAAIPANAQVVGTLVAAIASATVQSRQTGDLS
ncbi:MAG: hypothetical protein ACM3NN_02415 [Nitrospirota bacterium]